MVKGSKPKSGKLPQIEPPFCRGSRWTRREYVGGILLTKNVVDFPFRRGMSAIKNRRRFSLENSFDS